MGLTEEFGTWLAAGAGRAEITPPLEVGLLMSSVEGRWEPFQGVRKPLFARALVLEERSPRGTADRPQRVAIISLDLLALSGKALGGYAEFKCRVSAAAAGVVAPDDIVLVCTHTHSAPESGAITDLHRTAAFAAWANHLASQIGLAIGAAASSLAPCQLAYGAAMAPGLGIHRRFKTTSGIMMSHPVPPEAVVLSRDGAVDDSVNVLSLREPQGKLVALVVNATCHPVYEMCLPHVSPDYPGELCAKLEEEHAGVVALFFNGAAGNINPTAVSAGPSAARRHAEQLGQAVERALDSSRSAPSPGLWLRRRSFELPTRLPHGEDTGQVLATEAVGLRLGDAALVFLPGEPFVETGVAVRGASPFPFTAVAGFAEETIGYIPTDDAFGDGGYETTFGPWSVLAPTSESILRRETAHLLQELAAADVRRPDDRAIPAPHVLDRVVSTRHGVADADDRVSSTFRSDL